MWRGLFSAEHVQEPFPSELRPSAMIYDLVVFEDFLLDVDIAMLGILGVQDVGSVLLELDMPLAQQTVQATALRIPSSLAISVVVYVFRTWERMATRASACTRASRSSFNWVASLISTSG